MDDDGGRARDNSTDNEFEAKLSPGLARVSLLCLLVNAMLPVWLNFGAVDAHFTLQFFPPKFALVRPTRTIFEPDKRRFRLTVAFIFARARHLRWKIDID